MRTMEEYARASEQYGPLEALTLLTKAYISMCGVSLEYRTVVYCAAEAWKEKLAWTDLPLSEMAREKPLVILMPHITSEYDLELYDEYDICGMDNGELLDGCREITGHRVFDKATNEVLCWGILKATEEREKQSVEIEATAADGTPLNGILTEQRCSATVISMTAPYHGLTAMKVELVRDASELLVRAYEDCKRLLGAEREIKNLFPQYQEELRKCKNGTHREKERIFTKIYGEIVGDTDIVAPEELLSKWFGLEFFDPYYNDDPSWL